MTGAGEDIVLVGYLMVNDLFNVEVAETAVVFRKASPMTSPERGDGQGHEKWRGGGEGGEERCLLP